MVDPKVEAPLREMLEYALRGEDEKLGDLIRKIGPEMYEQAAALAIVASGYIAVRVSTRWPQEVDIKALAKHAATTKGARYTQDEIAAYLSRVVLRSESPLALFEDQEKAAVLPIFATAYLLLSFSAQYDTQWKFLDAIWNSIEVSDQLPDDVLPGAVFRFLRK